MVRPPDTPAPWADCTSGAGVSRDTNGFASAAVVLVALASGAGLGAESLPQRGASGEAGAGVESSAGPALGCRVGWDGITRCGSAGW